MLVLASTAMIAMHEVLKVAKLKLDSGANAVTLHHLRATLNDRRSMGDAPLVVVRQVEDEEILKIELSGIGHGSLFGLIFDGVTRL